ALLRCDAPPAARIAKHAHVGQEAHLDLLEALAFAPFAAASSGIEGEAAGAVAANARLGGFGEEPPDRVPEPNVSRRARARRLTDWRLVDFEHPNDLSPAADVTAAGECGPILAASIRRRESSLEIVVQYVARQCGFPGTRHTGDRDQPAERDLNLHPLQVMERR